MSIFLEVLAFEVRADPFADLSAGVGEKIDLFQIIGFGGKHRFYLLEVFHEIGGNADYPSGFEAADELVGVGIVDETPSFVAFFGPRVGEVKVEAIDGGIGDTFGDIADGICANYSDVGQIPPANPVNGETVKFACPFNPDKIGVGLASCLVYQKRPLT
jgi:hypothetical protein